MSPHRKNRFPRRRSRRRGSILLLVIVFLTVLVLLATMLAYMSKLEAQSAENAALGVQARMSAVTGVAGARRFLAGYGGEPIAGTQSWARRQPLFSDPSETDALADTESADRAASPISVPTADPSASPTPTPIPSGHIAIDDQCARININAVQPYPATSRKTDHMPLVSPGVPAESLEALIALRLADTGREPSAARAMTQGILDARLGPDGWPGDGALRQGFEEFQTDLRRAPRGDDRPILNLGAAKTLAQMPEDLWKALEPFLTAFSSSPEIWSAPPSGRAAQRAPLNSAGARKIYETLRDAFPQAPPTLLKQFAVNLVDRRDADSLPTVYEDDVEPLPVMGYEKTVVVSEVCPDVMTPSRYGDNGEYIEIYNPLDEAVDLSGWTLNWQEGEMSLKGLLPPGGFLIVTDDIKDSNDPTPERDMAGMGSFYEVFKILPYSSKTLLVEEPDMNIPDISGTVRLFDAQRRPIDYLTYSDAAFDGINRGFQKIAPFARKGVPSLATPFEHGFDDPPTTYDCFCRDVLDERMNQPFETVAEVLTVPAMPPDQGERWIFPSVDFPGSTALGLGLLDCLTEKSVVAKESDSKDEILSFGRINLNTASRAVLSVLPGLDDALVERIVAYRERIETEDHATGFERVPFVSLSDFAANKDVWQGREAIDRLKSLMVLCPIATTRSTAFLITSTALIDRPRPGKDTRGLTCRALVNMVEGKTQVLAWEFVPPAREESLAVRGDLATQEEPRTDRTGGVWGKRVTGPAKTPNR
ncbi:general secretion pathway protein GspK [Candidatus Sumerlaeota bacterium]|nr:general secretion pathway protein GspK [Candidatus Sumerlaeota bacterium]